MTSKDLLCVLVLVLLVLCVFNGIQTHDFIALDDGAYVKKNPDVKQGLTLSSIIWAFTSIQVSLWIPVTWLSLMMDYEIYGLDAGGFLITNLIFHLLNTLLLFSIFRKSTKNYLCSFFIAALFAIHPLRIESVAWVTERKDVLSGFFWFLCMYFYMRYVEEKRYKYLIVVCLFFILGFMSKPMIVTLPFALLLFDFWPLNRFQNVLGSQPIYAEKKAFLRRLWELFLEKKLLFGMTFIFIGFVVFIPMVLRTLAPLEKFPMPLRIANALFAYIRYIGKFFYPTDLFIFYPFPIDGVPAPYVSFSVAVLVLVTGFVIWMGHRYGYLVFGWFWFLGTLLPVIGIVQAGNQAMADRFTYIPLIGLFSIVVWGTFEMVSGAPRKKYAWVSVFVVVIIALSLVSHQYLGAWKNTETIFLHGLKNDPDNYMAHEDLAAFYAKRGKLDKAYPHFIRVLELKPDDSHANYNMGSYYLHRAKELMEKAPPLGAYRQWLDFTVKIKALASKGVEYLEKAVEAGFPLEAGDHNLFIGRKNVEIADELIDIYQKQIDMGPDPERAYRLGELYQLLKKDDVARYYFEQAASFDPPHTEAIRKLAVDAARNKAYDKAKSLFEEIVDTDNAVSNDYYNLARIYAIQNNSETSLNYLDAAVENGFDSYQRLMDDKYLASLHTMERFQEIADKIKTASSPNDNTE